LGELALWQGSFAEEHFDGDSPEAT